MPVAVKVLLRTPFYSGMKEIWKWRNVTEGGFSVVIFLEKNEGADVFDS